MLFLIDHLEIKLTVGNVYYRLYSCFVGMQWDCGYPLPFKLQQAMPLGPDSAIKLRRPLWVSFLPRRSVPRIQLFTSSPLLQQPSRMGPNPTGPGNGWIRIMLASDSTGFAEYRIHRYLHMYTWRGCSCHSRGNLVGNILREEILRGQTSSAWRGEETNTWEARNAPKSGILLNLSYKVAQRVFSSRLLIHVCVCLLSLDTTDR